MALSIELSKKLETIISDYDSIEDRISEMNRLSDFLAYLNNENGNRTIKVACLRSFKIAIGLVMGQCYFAIKYQIPEIGFDVLLNKEKLRLSFYEELYKELEQLDYKSL